MSGMTSSPRFRSTVAVAALLAPLALAACVQAPPAGEDLAVLAGWSDLSADDRAARLTGAELRLDGLLAAQLGVDAGDLPRVGAQPAPILIAPASITTAGTPDLATAAGNGLSLLAGAAGDAFAATVEVGTGQGGTPAGTQPAIAWSIDRGSVSADIRSVSHAEVGGQAVTTTVSGELEMLACPDARGWVDGTIVARVQIDVGGRSSSYTFDGRLDGRVGDDAFIRYLVVQGAGSLGSKALRNGKVPASGLQSSVETVIETRFTGEQGTAGESIGTVHSFDQGIPKADAATVKELKDGQRDALAVLGQLLAEQAESYWRSGGCVQIVTDPWSLGTVDPDSAYGFDMTVQAKSDLAEITSGVLEIEHTEGEGELNTEARRPAPFRLTFVTGPEGDRNVLQLRHVSKRGIGLGDIVMQSQAPGWQIDATVETVRTTAIKCGPLDGEWNMLHTGIGWGYNAQGYAVIDAGSHSGPYAIVGDVDGIGFSGGSTAHITGQPDGTYVFSVDSGPELLPITPYNGPECAG
jgi:hypothetical protein